MLLFEYTLCVGFTGCSEAKMLGTWKETRKLGLAATYSLYHQGNYGSD